MRNEFAEIEALLEVRETEAVRALLLWLHEVGKLTTGDDRHALIDGDGRPLALEVLTVLNALGEARARVKP